MIYLLKLLRRIMNNLLIYIIVSLLCGLICFLSTTDILLGVLVLAIYILVFILLINKKFVRYNTKIKRFHSCYLFINNYIVALSIKKSLKTALETTSLTLDDDFNDLYKSYQPKLETLVMMFNADSPNLHRNSSNKLDINIKITSHILIVLSNEELAK